MGLYEAFKDALSIAQKADNAPLIQSLLDVQQQVLELQEENAGLKAKNKELKDIKELEKRIMRHEYTIVTLDGEEQAVCFCSTCWDNSRKLIQVQKHDNGQFNCPLCQNSGIYSKELKDESLKRIAGAKRAQAQQRAEKNRRSADAAQRWIGV